MGTYNGTLWDRLGSLELFNPKGMTVLDMGCHRGHIAYEMARRGAALVHGFDIRPKHVEFARKMLEGVPTPHKFFVADADKWQPKREYDIVLCLGVVHHMKSPERINSFIDAATDLFVLRTKMDIHVPGFYEKAISEKPNSNVGRLTVYQREINFGSLIDLDEPEDEQ